MALAPGITLTGVSFTITSLTGSGSAWTGSASVQGSFAVSLTAGGWSIAGSGTLTVGYALAGQALDSGTLSFAVNDLNLQVSSGGTSVASIVAAQASISQTGSDLVVSATGVSASVAGGQLTLSSGTFTLTSLASSSRLTFALTAATAAAGSAAGLTLSDVAVSYGASGLSVAGSLALSVAGQTMAGTVQATATGDTVTLTVSALSLDLGAGTAQRIVIADGSGTLTLTAAGWSGTLTATAQASGLLNASVAASLALSGTSVRVAIAVTGQSLLIGTSGQGVQVSAASVVLIVASDGSGLHYAIDASGTLALVGFAGVAAAGSARLRLNSFLTGFTTTVGASTVTFGATEVGTATSRFLSIEVNGATLSILGQSVVADLAVTETTSGGVTQTLLTLSDGSLTISDGTSTLFALDTVQGSLSLSSAGIAGTLSANVVTGLAGFSFTGAVSVALNTAAEAVGDLPAGPYLRIGVLAAKLTVAGQELGADLVVTRTTDSTGATVLAIVISNGSLSLAGGALTLTAGTGNLVLTSTGTSGTLSGAIALNLAAVSLTGSLAVSLDTASGQLAVTGSGISLDVLGQTLTGDLSIESASSSTTLTVTNATLRLGGSLVTLTGASAVLGIAADGVWGAFSGDLALAISGLEVSGTFSAQVNTTASVVTVAGVALAAGTVRIGGTVLTITVGGVAVSGEVWFARTPTGIELTLAHGSLSIGSYVTISEATATLVVTAAGVAGSFTAHASLVVPGVAGFEADVSVNLDTATASLAVVVANADLTFGAGRLTGSVSFSRSTTGGVTETIVALSGITAYLGTSTSPAVHNGSGVLVLRAGGVAGYLSGTTSASSGSVSVSGSVLLQINTSGEAVDTSVELAGQTLSVKFATGDPVFALTLSDLSLTIGDFVTIEGSVTFSNQTITVGGSSVAAQVFAGTGLSIFLGRGPVKLASGAINPLAIGVMLSNARIGLISYNGGHALVASGTVSDHRRPGRHHHRHHQRPGQHHRQRGHRDPADPRQHRPGHRGRLHRRRRGVTEFGVSSATLAFGGQTMTGSFGFSRVGTDVQVTIADAALDFGGAVTIGAISGSFLLQTAGLTGRTGRHHRRSRPSGWPHRRDGGCRRRHPHRDDPAAGHRRTGSP